MYTVLEANGLTAPTVLATNFATTNEANQWIAENAAPLPGEQECTFVVKTSTVVFAKGALANPDPLFAT